MSYLEQPLPAPAESLTAVPALVPLPPMKTEVMVITPELAWQWLEARDYEYQRNLRESWAQTLADAMRRHEFEDTQSVVFHYCQERGGAKFLTNAQHRLRAIVLSGIPQAMPIVHKWVRTWADVQAAYSRIDRGLTRTHHDAFRAMGLDQELGLNGSQLQQFGAAAAVLISGFQPTAAYPESRSIDRRVAIMRGWAQEGRMLFALYEGIAPKWRQRLTNATPLALALVTFRYARSAAESFWRDVAWGEGLDTGDTVYHLREYLNAGRSSGTLSTRQLMWAIARAWNGYYRGKTVTLFKNLDKKAPLELAGTPYNGRDIIEVQG